MSSSKNPEHEAENPAPMPRSQQGRGGHHDDVGQQVGGMPVMPEPPAEFSPLAITLIASGDPAAILDVTANPSEENRPSVMATTSGAELALIGRSNESATASR